MGILKIIFLVLLFVILFLLVTLVAVLFVPIFYKVDVKKDDDLYINIKANWLLGFLYFKFQRENSENLMDLRILGFKVNNRKESKIIAFTKRTTKKISNILSRFKRNNIKKKKQEVKNEKESKNENPIEKQQEKTDHKIKMQEELDEHFEKDSKKTKKQKKAKKKKNEKKELKGKMSSGKDKFNDIKEKFYYIKNHPKRTDIYNCTKTCIKQLLKRIIPKKYNINAIIGFDDPSKTGMIMGAIYAIKPFLFFDARIDPNFQEEILEINCTLKGNLSFWDLLYPIIKYILHEPIWKIVKKFFLRKD